MQRDCGYIAPSNRRCQSAMANPVLIIGAGIVGLTIAHGLKKFSHQSARRSESITALIQLLHNLT